MPRYIGVACELVRCHTGECRMYGGVARVGTRGVALSCMRFLVLFCLPSDIAHERRRVPSFSYVSIIIFRLRWVFMLVF